jgi:hypothetical protein
VSYIKNSSSRISGLFAVRNECSFYSMWEKKIRTAQKKSRWLVTLVGNSLQETTQKTTVDMFPPYFLEYLVHVFWGWGMPTKN